MPGEIWALLQRGTHLYLLMPRRWRAVFPPVISGMPRQTLVPGTSYIRTLQECCTTVWLVFSSTARMHCWVLPGSVQLQDYCIRPEKNGELFSCRYRKLYLPQTHADVQMHLCIPIQPSNRPPEFRNTQPQYNSADVPPADDISTIQRSLFYDLLVCVNYFRFGRFWEVLLPHWVAVRPSAGFLWGRFSGDTSKYGHFSRIFYNIVHSPQFP